MKMYTSIAHFSGQEQEALLSLKNKLVELYKPLFIYLIGCSSSSCVTRNCFNNPKSASEWSLSSDFLLILPEGAVVSGNTMEELRHMNKNYRKVRLIVHPLVFFENQLKEYSLFFCWIQHQAIMLYKKDTFNKKLLEPVQNMKQYEKQAESFFANSQYYKDHTKIKLSPLPNESLQLNCLKELPEQQSKMNITLQNKISRFLKERGAKSISSSIRQAIIYYGSSSSHFDIQNKVTSDFKSTLMDLLELLDIFDEADMEYKKEKNAFKNS